MKTKPFVVLVLIVLAVTILSACGGAPATEMPRAAEVAPQVTTKSGAADSNYAGEPAALAEQGVAKSAPGASGGGDYSTLPDISPNQSSFSDHLIIKNAEVSILVEDSDVALDRLTQVVSDVGGYIISSRVWFQEFDKESYKYATITIGVPVDQFEIAMRRTRGLALKVQDEKASGEDVTDQFVDLQSRLTNLEATRDRIQSFLADAKTVDEALRINEELAAIEAQIEEVKGRMNYLSDRSAFSTITVTVSPELPEIEPLPTPEPAAWNPGVTLQHATETLTETYQGFVDFGIWLLVVVVPIMGPPALVIWLIVRMFRRKPSAPVASGED